MNLTDLGVLNVEFGRDLSDGGQSGAAAAPAPAGAAPAAPGGDDAPVSAVAGPTDPLPLAAAAALYSAADADLDTAKPIETAAAPDVDVLIRTSGEKRLSDFLLWECAYAELVFVERMWPDFTGDDLREAVEEFRQRDRRFGRVSVGGA